MSNTPTTRTDELMRRQYARLSEAAALARAEIVPLDTRLPLEEQAKAIEAQDRAYAKVDGLMTAQEIITQTWKEYLGC